MSLKYLLSYDFIVIINILIKEQRMVKVVTKRTYRWKEVFKILGV